MHDPGDAQRRRARLQFVQPGLRALAVRWSHDPVSGDDNDHPVALCCQPGQRPAGQQHLVVRMGMKSNDRRHAGNPGERAAP